MKKREIHYVTLYDGWCTNTIFSFEDGINMADETCKEVRNAFFDKLKEFLPDYNHDDINKFIDDYVRDGIVNLDDCIISDNTIVCYTLN